MKSFKEFREQLNEVTAYDKWQKSKQVKRAESYGFEFYDAQEQNGGSEVALIFSDEGNGGERKLSDIFGTTDIDYMDNSFWVYVSETMNESKTQKVELVGVWQSNNKVVTGLLAVNGKVVQSGNFKSLESKAKKYGSYKFGFIGGLPKGCVKEKNGKYEIDWDLAYDYAKKYDHIDQQG